MIWASSGPPDSSEPALPGPDRARSPGPDPVAAPRVSSTRSTSTRLAAEAAPRRTRRTGNAVAGADVVVLAAGPPTPDAAASAGLTGANALLPGWWPRPPTGPGSAGWSTSARPRSKGGPVLDESTRTAPSRRTHGKALGEAVLTASEPALDRRWSSSGPPRSRVPADGPPRRCSGSPARRSPRSPVGAPTRRRSARSAAGPVRRGRGHPPGSGAVGRAATVGRT